jgi:hypothetical protein
MTVEIALLGKPSCGKSSFFKAATMIDVKITGIPFCTIEPNIGVSYVTVDCVCKKYNVKCKPKSGVCKDGKRFIPVKLIDVAGLVPGSHEGRGLGNRFLDDLRQAAVLIHVVDCSGTRDAEGKITTGYDPSFDIEFLEKEIDLWFAGVIRKAIEKFARISTSSQPDLVQILSENLSGLQISKEHIRLALDKSSIGNIENFATVIRKVSKPIVIAANKIDMKSSQENYEKLKEKYKDLLMIPTSAEFEIALKKASEKGLIEYSSDDDFKIIDPSKLDDRQKDALEIIRNEVIKKYGSTGVQECLNRAVFDRLNYIVVYPVADINKLTDSNGNVLPDAFLVKKGTNLKEFAFLVHSDIGEKFIGGLEAKTKRKLGADYILQNNDVVEILFQKR